MLVANLSDLWCNYFKRDLRMGEARDKYERMYALIDNEELQAQLAEICRAMRFIIGLT